MTRLLQRGFLGLVAVAAMTVASATNAFAMPYLDFSINAVHVGTTLVSYAGGAAPVIGVDITVDDVAGIGTPLNNFDIQPITGGLLAFTTGASTGVWQWTGGTVSLKGGIAGIGIAAGSTLFTGTIVGLTSIGPVIGGGQRLLAYGFVDEKHPDLLAHYGLPSGSYDGAFNIRLTITGSPGSAFSVVPGSGELSNTPTPEPGTLLLLGSGLLGLRYLSRRRRHG